ncbi:ABC transporter, transmembrane domain, type 1 [Niveomyces insectorum RCEF 264]|uniref:ABC transporter, transmembrane domain, type 1 n=1 Tax=Niveomyces insectorum RCEF 264 TaxID=1081102 RepID=A0A167W877_9HYPO|nr:ABC transporter, transmembrane domain, type 1 [Niveomyces insectorum RCEF 264]
MGEETPAPVPVSGSLPRGNQWHTGPERLLVVELIDANRVRSLPYQSRSARHSRQSRGTNTATNRSKFVWFVKSVQPLCLGLLHDVGHQTPISGWHGTPACPGSFQVHAALPDHQDDVLDGRPVAAGCSWMGTDRRLAAGLSWASHFKRLLLPDDVSIRHVDSRQSLQYDIHQDVESQQHGSRRVRGGIAHVHGHREHLSKRANLHELWASPIEAAVAVFLLYRQLGLAALAPIVVAILVTNGMLQLARFFGTAKKKWMRGIQTRVDVTASVLASMKEVKMLGLSDVVATMIQNLRVTELDLSKQYRRLMTIQTFIAMNTATISPLATFATFVVISNSTGRLFNTETDYTSLSLIYLLLPLEERNHFDPDEADTLVAITGASFGWSPRNFPKHTILFAALVILYAGGFRMTALVLSFWTHTAEESDQATNNFYLGLFGMLTAFFSRTDVGVTTNRFSQDMSVVDTELPFALIDFCVNFALIIMSIILMCVFSGYFAAVLVPFIAFCWLLQNFYVRTSRQVRLFDLEAKSPLFTQFLDLLQGLSTVRAFAWGPRFVERYLDLLDASQKPFYLLYCIQRWLGLVLDLLTAVLVTVMMALAVKLRAQLSPSYVALAFVQIMSFGQSLARVIQDWTQFETSFGAVARVKTFCTDTESEKGPAETGAVPENWPAHGRVTIENLTASYDTRGGSEPVLRGVSLDIPAGAKVGICGRSGSGKSSLLGCILRLLEVGPGSRITIDGVDITTLPRQAVRAAVAVVPQHPFFLKHTSLRDNLVVLRRQRHGQEHEGQEQQQSDDDNKILQVLRQLKMDEVVDRLGGLDSPLDAERLSQGQRQLLCIARAMLARNWIILIDEASSNVGERSERLIRDVMRQQFAGCTVIAVAHRLGAVVDFNRVAGHELHLPSGPSVGHRSLNKYDRQNLHNYPPLAEREKQAELAIEADVKLDEDFVDVEDDEGVRKAKAASRVLTQRNKATSARTAKVNILKVERRQEMAQIMAADKSRIKLSAHSIGQVFRFLGRT